MTEPGMEPTTPSPEPRLWNRPWFIVLAVIAVGLVVWLIVSGGGETDTGTETTVGQSDTTSPESATTVGPTDTTAPEEVSETTTAAETTPETTVAPATTVVSTTAATAEDTLAYRPLLEKCM